MPTKRQFHINQLRDYSSLFSRREVNRWYKSDFSSLKMKINRYDSNLLDKQYSYLRYLKHVYKILEQFYPNEYIYKNELIGKWLSPDLGSADSIVFSEFRVGNAVADVAMFNGVSKAFEIKTLLDKDVRLSNQLTQYRRLFNQIYLVIPEKRLNMYLKYNQSAGIIAYDESSGHFTLVRQADLNEDFDVDVLMEVLHTREYVRLVQDFYGVLPAFHDFNKFEICKELIRRIPVIELNKRFIELMKARRNYNLFSKKDCQLNQIFLSMNFDLSQKRQLISNLNTTIS